MTTESIRGFRGEKNSPDILLWFSVGLLVTIGMVMVFSASSYLASNTAGSSVHYLKNHAIRVAFACCAFLVAYIFPYKLLTKLARLFIFLSIVSLVAVLFSGDVVRGSSRWLALGPITIQPSEIAKLAVVIYIADFLSRKRGDRGNFRKGLQPCLIVLGTIVGLVALQRNLSCVVHIGLISSVMLFLGGVRLRYLGAIGGLFLIVASLSLAFSPYQRDRLMSFVNREFEPLGRHYQVHQSLIALGSGGPTGLGLGQSKQKYYFLPDAHTDFVLAVVGEEGGFGGTALVMTLFLIFGWRGFRIAARVPDMEGRLLASGVTLMVFLYAMLNVAVVTWSIPTTGVPLPFVSYGGSSLLAGLFGTGVLLNISTRASRAYASADVARKRLEKRSS